MLTAIFVKSAERKEHISIKEKADICKLKCENSSVRNYQFEKKLVFL